MYNIVINTGEVYKEGDILVAPCEDINNIDYQAYVAWINSGNTPAEIFKPSDDYEFKNGGFVLKLDVIKGRKLSELTDIFEKQFQYGKFLSSLGFYVDNRRYGDKNDKDNIQSLIDIGITVFKDADNNFHNVTLEQLQIIKLEMTQDGLKKYQTKWYYEGLIQSAQSVEELESIQIVF